jgi:inosose dehydratase
MGPTTPTSVVTVAISPVTWGVDFADAPTNPPWEQVLDEIAASGVGALELGPVGYLPEDPERLLRALASRHLTSVGSFLFDDLHDPEQRDRVLTLAERVGAFTPPPAAACS